MDDKERIKVLVSHDSPLLQAGLLALLGRHADLDCAVGAGSASLGDCGRTPDVIVADHRRAIEWVTAMSRDGPRVRPRVLAVTYSDRECDIRAAISAGVQGYLLVDDAPEHLAAAVRIVQPRGSILSPRVASRLAESVAGEALTQREQAVLGRVIAGLCNKSIANQLGITAGTVKSHLRSAFGKLGVVSRTQAIAMAHRRGLFHRDDLSAAPGHALCPLRYSEPFPPADAIGGRKHESAVHGNASASG
jgi:DNA-binding NarL/FixJ family response regulator